MGHKVNWSGIATLKKTQAVQDFSHPSNKTEVQRFLGFVNFYRRFIPAAAKILKPLTDSLAGSNRGFEWATEMERSFQKAKTALANAPLLVHPSSSATISLAVDASVSHVGAVLQQLQEGVWAPLAFFSENLSKTEDLYSTFDGELLAAYSAIRHFRFSLEGRDFQLWTDHKPLCSAIGRVSPPWSARQQRQLSYIAEFTFDLRYIPGLKNAAADALSRPHCPDPVPIVSVTTCVVSRTEMEKQQKYCPELQQLYKCPDLQIQRVPINGASIVSDVSTGSPRPLVPQACRQKIFFAFHNLAHPRVRTTRRLISSRFV